MSTDTRRPCIDRTLPNLLPNKQVYGLCRTQHATYISHCKASPEDNLLLANTRAPLKLKRNSMAMNPLYV